VAKSFKDAQGREWHPKVTCLTLQRYEEDAGIALLTAFNAPAPKKETDQARGRRMNEVLFHGRMGNLVKLAFFACAREIQERGVGQEDFAEALADQAMMVAASEAAGEALADFFQSRPAEK